MVKNLRINQPNQLKSIIELESQKGPSLADSALRLYQEYHKTSYDLRDLMVIYAKTNIYTRFLFDEKTVSINKRKILIIRKNRLH